MCRSQRRLFMAAWSWLPRFSAKCDKKAPVSSAGPWLAIDESMRAMLKKAISSRPQYRSRKKISMRDQTNEFATAAAPANRA